MSGLSGSLQQDPRNPEGIQPRTPKGIQQREFLDHISISASSLVTPPQFTGEGLQPDTPTPTPNCPPGHNEGVQGQVIETENVSMANQGWDIEADPDPTAWSNTGNEGLQGHVTVNASGSQTQDSSTEVPMQITPITPHQTSSVPPTNLGTTQQPSTPKNTVPPPRQMLPLPYQEGQTILGMTKRGGGESPLAYVSSGSSTASTPSISQQPSKRSRLIQRDDMEIEALGYQTGESPSNNPQSINTTPSNSGSPPRVSFAQMVKGKGKETASTENADQNPSNTPLLNRTWCKLQEFSETRIPPITDVLYSVWMNLEGVYEDQSIIYGFAAKNPNVCGLSYRPTSAWTEFYCKSQNQMETLLKQEWTVGQTTTRFIPAKKLAGSRVFLKLANVTPCFSEDETREAIAKVLQPYGTPGEIQPHYIVDPTGEFPDDLLCTRRWDAELFIPEKHRLIMDSTPEILGNTTIIYWKGQYPVCMFCQVQGHWARNCNSTLRAKAQADRISKIPPVPFNTQETSPPQTTTPAIPQPETIPIQSTSKSTPPQKEQAKATPSGSSPQQKTPQEKTPVKQTPLEQNSPKTVPQIQTARVVKERDIIQKSKEVNVASGSATTAETIVIRDDDDGWKPVQTRKQRQAKLRADKYKKARESGTDMSGSESNAEGSKRWKPTPRLPPTAIQTSNRPRTVGNQLQYYLYLMSRGQILTTELQGYINKADPVAFITTTKPSMKQKDYEAFTNWVSKRRRAGKDDMQEAARWKVSIPDHMNPNNTSYVDTTISAKQYYELEEKRLNKQGKLTIWLSDGTSSDLTTSVTISFKPKEKMSTLARVIKKKFELNYPIDLRLTGNEQKLNITGMADQAGLQDGMTLFASRAQEEPSAESAEESVKIQIQRNDSGKVWSCTLPLSASTTHLYHQFTQLTHQQHGHFTIYRSNGTRVGRFSLIKDLHLCKNEVFTYRSHVPTLVKANWLDSTQKEHQRKPTFVDKDTLMKDLDAILIDEFNLDFRFDIVMEHIYGTDAIKYYTNDANVLVVYLAQPGLEWDDKNFTPAKGVKEVMAITTGFLNIRTISMEVFPGSTVADFAQLIYSQVPETQSKVLEDRLGLPYELTDQLEHIVPKSGIISMRVNIVQSYTAEQASLALQTIAIQRATTAEALAADPLSTLTK